MAAPRKYDDATLDRMEKLSKGGMAWHTINEIYPGGYAAVSARTRRGKTVGTCDVLYCASYYKENGLQSPYE